jgi:hypothetical protein
MFFTLEQDKFLIMSYYRNGVKMRRAMDIQRSSLQRRIFSQLPGPKCFRKVTAFIHRIINCFVTTDSDSTYLKRGNREVVPR